MSLLVSAAISLYSYLFLIFMHHSVYFCVFGKNTNYNLVIKKVFSYETMYKQVGSFQIITKHLHAQVSFVAMHALVSVPLM